MQEIHEKVTVFVTQRDLQKRSTEKDGAYASTTALQYVAENAGFDVVTFRVDFSQSASIKLHRPDPVSGTLQKSTLEMAFECELQPFERRVLAYLVRKKRKRAFVRVQYAVTAVVTPSVDAIVQAQERTAKTIDQQLRHSNRTFLDVSKWKLLPCRPTAEVAQACAEINRHFQQFGIGFIDPTFPPQTKALYDPDASNQLSDADAAVYGLCRWEHVRTVVDSSWIFVVPKTSQTKVELASRVSFTSGLPAQDSFLCALSIVAPYCKLWLPRWFPTLNAASQVERMMVVPVALCDRGLRWQQFLVDLFLPSFPLGRGIMTARNIHGELYASLLHKAYAKLKGDYAAITSISTMNILRELTGSPWVCLYDRTAEQVQLQEVVKASLSHGQSEDKEGSLTLVVFTFGNIDDHHRAFQVTIPSGKGSVILHDSSGEYLLKVMKANDAAAFDWDQEDPSALRVSWEQLSALDPVVWSLSLGCRYEKRMRQISLHEGGTVMMTVAISIPSFTTITFSPSYSTRCESEGPQMDLDVSIAAVESDFSMVDINVDESFEILHNHDGVVSKQMVRTLSAGEYVVTISAKHPGRSESHPDASKVEEAEPESESEKTRAELTPTSTDTNLQLVFDCLDREGNHELSESDIINFLQVYEHVTPLERGEAALLSFLEQRGSSLTPGTNEKRLSMEDFREIYLTQALEDCKGETYTSARVRTRFQELIWQDVLRLLTRSRCDVEAESARSAIDCRYLAEMACSFHSDVPLLSVVVLSDDDNNI